MSPYRLLFDDVMRRLGWHFPVLIAWTALVGISESVSVLLLLPLFNRLGITGGGTQGFAATLVDKALGSLGATTTIAVLAVVIAAATFQLVISVALTLWTTRLARTYQARRQLEMFASFMRAKWVFIADRRGGELTNAIVTESERLGRAFTISLALLASVVISAIYLVLSALVSWQITLALVVFAGLASLGMTGLYRKSYSIGAKLAPLNAQVQSLLEEHFAGAKFVKASNAVDRAAERLEPLIFKIGDANVYATAMPLAVRSVLEYVALIVLGIVLALATVGSVSASNVVIVLALFARLFPRVTTLQAQFHYLNANVHAIEAINVLQSTADEQAERQDGVLAPLALGKPAVLSVRDLEVKFGDRVILDQVTLQLKLPGLLAIVGPSGAGKSTLVNVLLGLVEPTAGSIGLGRYNLAKTALRSWRGAIGYVAQETMLFHASIRDNLLIVNPKATQDEIEEASRRAHAYDFIVTSEKGFDTIIGDQGMKLSGGQRQRLGIARALLQKPSLLVLDEPMSALDAESEAVLMRTIDDLRREIGIVMVAHRLGSLRNTDCICVLEKGRVVEVGNWNELMNRQSRLYSLVQAQGINTGRAAVVG